MSSLEDVPRGKATARGFGRRMARLAKRTRTPAARVPANGMLETAAGDDDPRLQDTAAHSLPNGADAVSITIGPGPAARVAWDSMDPGTRQVKAPAARQTRSQRHLSATIQG